MTAPSRRKSNPSAVKAAPGGGRAAEKPPAKRRPRRQPSEKPDVIIDAAGKVFRAHGYSNATVDEIASVANVSKATIYAHFGGKEALFSACVERAAQQGGFRALADDDGSVPLREALVLAGRRFLELILTPEVAEVFRMVMAETPRQPALGRLFYRIGPERGQAALAAFLSARAARGEIVVEDTGVAAGHYLSLLRGDRHLRFLFGIGGRPTKAEIEAQAEEAVTCFLRFCRPD